MTILIILTHTCIYNIYIYNYNTYVCVTYIYIYNTHIHIHTYTYTFFRLKPSGRFQQLHFSHFLSVPADKTALVMPGFVQHALVFREFGVLASATEGVKSSFLEESGLGRNFGPKNTTILDCPVEIPTTKFRRP